VKDNECERLHCAIVLQLHCSSLLIAMARVGSIASKLVQYMSMELNTKYGSEFDESITDELIKMSK